MRHLDHGLGAREDGAPGAHADAREAGAGAVQEDADAAARFTDLAGRHATAHGTASLR